MIERIVEKPKIVEVTQPIREIQHLPPVVAPLQVNAPISIAEAGDLLKGTGVIGQGTYGEYLERDRGVGVGERVAEKMEERERKKQEAWVEEKEVMRPSGAA